MICLEELLQGDTIARLPCLCIYHKRYEGAGRPGSATPTPEGSFPVVGGESQPSGGPWAASKQRPARGDVWTCGAQSRGGLWIPGPLEGWVCVCLHEPPLLRSVQTLVCAAGPARRALLAASAPGPAPRPQAPPSAPGPAPRPGGSSQAPPIFTTCGAGRSIIGPRFVLGLQLRPLSCFQLERRRLTRAATALGPSARSRFLMQAFLKPGWGRRPRGRTWMRLVRGGRE